MDSASDSRKRNGAVSEDGAPVRKSDRDLWLHGDEARRSAGWDKEPFSQGASEKKAES